MYKSWILGNYVLGSKNTIARCGEKVKFSIRITFFVNPDLFCILRI